MADEQDVFLGVQASLENAPRGIFQVSLPGEPTGESPEDGTAPEDGAAPESKRGKKEPPHLTVRTALVYPGSGEKIEVYVRPRGSGFLLTDRGATMAMLGRYLSSDTEDEERWEPAVKKLCEGLPVRMQGREWTVRAKKAEDVGQAAMLLSQALLRAAIMAPIFKITRDSRR